MILRWFYYFYARFCDGCLTVQILAEYPFYCTTNSVYVKHGLFVHSADHIKEHWDLECDNFEFHNISVIWNLKYLINLNSHK